MFRNSGVCSDKTHAVPDTVEEDARRNMCAKGREPKRHGTGKKDGVASGTFWKCFSAVQTWQQWRGQQARVHGTDLAGLDSRWLEEDKDDGLGWQDIRATKDSS